MVFNLYFVKRQLYYQLCSGIGTKGKLPFLSIYYLLVIVYVSHCCTMLMHHHYYSIRQMHEE